MKITILTMGTHGDVRPYVALALGLKARGHHVRLATDPKDHEFCKNLHLEFFPLAGDLTNIPLLKESLENELLNKRSAFNKISFFLYLMKAINHLLDKQFQDVLEAAKDSDLLIYHPIVCAAPHVAEALNIRSYRMSLQPDIRTKEHPASVMQSRPPFGKLGNYISHLMLEQAFWQPIRKKINRWRVDQLNLRKMNFFGPYFEKRYIAVPQLLALSPSLVPFPSDWKSNVQMVGFCHLKTASSYTPSEDLLDFLNGGEAPLYLGFGSLSSSCPKPIVKQIIESISHKRAIISKDLPGIDEITLPDNFFKIGSCPHDWLFPKMSAVIHHGGAGTTAAGLAVGKPTYILPFVADQFFWGMQLFELGLGPSLLPIKSFDSFKFKKSIDDLTSNPTYKKNALAMSEKLLMEDGIENAIRIIGAG